MRMGRCDVCHRFTLNLNPYHLCKVCEADDENSKKAEERKTWIRQNVWSAPRQKESFESEGIWVIPPVVLDDTREEHDVIQDEPGRPKTESFFQHGDSGGGGADREIETDSHSSSDYESDSCDCGGDCGSDD